MVEQHRTFREGTPTCARDRLFSTSDPIFVLGKRLSVHEVSLKWPSRAVSVNPSILRLLFRLYCVISLGVVGGDMFSGGCAPFYPLGVSLAMIYL